jgi:TolA-binding protein
MGSSYTGKVRTMSAARTDAGSQGRRQTASAALRLMLAILVILAAQPAMADDALDDYQLAVGFYNKDEWQLAAENFQAFLKNHGQHPKAENARFYFGLTLVKLDDFKQARDVLRNFVKAHPASRNVTAASYWIGHSSYFLDDFAAAETELDRFVGLASQDPLLEWALPFLADAELRLKKPEAALKHLQQALDAFPKGEMAEDSKFGLARCYEQLKKAPEAIRTYQELAANRTGSRAAEAQLNLGNLHFDAEDFAAAAADFEVFEQRFPESKQMVQAQLNRGYALFQLHEYQKAAAQFDKAGKSEEYAAEAALWKGLSLKGLSDFPQAIAVLKAAYEKYRDQPLAEKLLYHWAQCEERRGAHDQARDLFVEVATRWPKGSLADESLHAACLAAIDAGKLPEAESLFVRFDREFPGNRLRLRQEILKGRVLAARKDFAGAAKLFQSVVATTEIESTRQNARYHLGFALQQLGQHAQVIEVTEPLVPQVTSDKALADYAAVFVLRAASQLELAKAAAAKLNPGEESAETAARGAEAVASAGKYRQIAPSGPHTAQALEVAAIAEALARKKEAALAYLAALRKDYPQTAELEQALFEIGTIAFSWEDFTLAEKLFAELGSRPKESRWHCEALADLGWSQHRQKKYVEAAATFARLIAEHPGDKLVPEAAFQRGMAFHDGGKIVEAQSAFADAWKLPGDAREIYLSGWWSARLLARLKKMPEADAAFDEVLKRFPKPKDGDKLLSEWAAIQYDAENYSRGDEIYRRLASEYPQSSLADNALLSLAESDLLAGKVDQARVQLTSLARSPAADETVQQRSLYQLIQVELGAKRWDELRKLCDESQDRFPDGLYRFEYDLYRAEADFNLGDFKAAQDRLLKLKALKDNPALKQAKWFSQVWVMLAEIEWRLKAYDAVAATVAEFRAWNPNSPLLYQADEVLGRSLKSQARFPEARVALERVIKDPNGKLSETAAKSQFLIADTYYWEKNYQAALKEYMTVDIRYKYPDLQASALYQAAVCQEEMERWKDAAKTYDEMLKKYPDSEHAAKAKERLDVVRKRVAAG